MLLYPQVSTSATGVDYAVGIAGSTLWNSIPSLTCSFKWFVETMATSVLTNMGLIVNNQTYRAHSTSATLNTTQTITIAQMFEHIILCTSSTVVTYTLPTGSNIHNGMIGGSSSTLAINQGFEWSIIKMSSSAGAVVISTSGSTNHSYYSNAALDVNKSGR